MRVRGTLALQFPGLMTLNLLLAMLLMAACGKDAASEPHESNLTLAEVSGLVDLTMGSRTLDPAALTVRTAAGTSRVGSDGHVTTMIFEEGPQFAEMRDSRGRTVMLAFASAGEPDFSALSTAKALAYLSVAGPWLLSEARLRLLDEVDTAPGFLPLLAAVESRLAGSGYLDVEDEGIQSALAGVAEAMNAAEPDSGQMVRPHGVIADPTTASGLSLDTTVEGKLTIENVYLRRVSLLFRRLSYKPASGQEVIENNAFTRVDMPTVDRYAGVVGTLEAYLEGKVAYSPVRTEPPLEIPRHPGDARSTTYQIYAIGPGFSFRPGLEVPDDVLAAQELLEMKAFFLDVFVVLMANVALPLKGDQIDEYLEFVGGNAVLGDFIATMKGTVPEVWASMQDGQWGEAARTLARSAVTSNTILPLLGQLTLDFLWKNTGINGDDYENMLGGMKTVLDTMGKVDVGLNALDTGLLAHDMARSSKVEQFLVTTTPGKLTLQAAAARIRPEETTTIDAIIQDRDPAGVYEFQCSVSPSASYWVEDGSLNGTDDAPDGVLVTRDSRLNIRSLVTTDGLATITCKAYRLDGGRQEVGEDDVVITFESQLEPNEVASTLVTVVTNSRINYDGGTQPRSESALVTTLVKFRLVPGKDHILLQNGNWNGQQLRVSDVAQGAPVYNPEIYYETGQWPVPYRSDWYNLGDGMAAYNYGGRTVVVCLGPFCLPNNPTLADAIAMEVARQQAQIRALGPKVFILP